MDIIIKNKEMITVAKSAIAKGVASEIHPRYYSDHMGRIATSMKKQARNFIGSEAFFMDDKGGMTMVEVMHIKGRKAATRVIETSPIKSTEFEIAEFIRIAKMAVRSVSKDQATIWANAGVDIYNNQSMDIFITGMVESIISTAGRSEKGNNITMNMITRDMVNNFFAQYMVDFVVNNIAKSGAANTFMDNVKASKDVVSYCFYYMNKEEHGSRFAGYKADNGFTAYQSDIGKDSIKSFAEVVYSQFNEYSDIIIEQEVNAGESIYSAITINPTIMENIVAKVTASKMSSVTTGYFVNQTIPEVNMDMVMGHASNIIGKEVSVRGADFNEDIGDTSIIVEAINHNNKSGFVIDQFMVDNYDDMAAAIKAAKEVD